MEGERPVHCGFGLVFVSDVELGGLPVHAPGTAGALEIKLVSMAAIEHAWSGSAPARVSSETTVDGQAFRVERGAAGDHRFTYGERASFHLGADGRTLLCAPVDARESAWRRVLLDSVLATVAMLREREALHAAAVAAPGGVVAFLGGTGGGKSVLAAELVRRGHPLVSDDVLALEREESGRIVAHPAPSVMNLPLDAPGAPPPDVLGPVLATFGQEAWVAVRNAAVEPAPIAAVCLLRRRQGLAPAVRRKQPGALQLLRHALHSGSAPERMQARFELLADLAAQAPAHVLEAAPDTPPERLADLVEREVAGFAAAPVGAAR